MRVELPPAQNAAGLAFPEITGFALTFKVSLTIVSHPVTELIPVTEYVVVDAGLAVTAELVVELRPVDGDHE